MTELLSWLEGVDRWLLLLINRSWSNAALDAVMPTLTDLHKVPWIVFGLGLPAAALWLWKGRAFALRVLVVAALAVGVCDSLSHRVLKPAFGRPRPRGGVVVRAPAGALSLPSNHAMNAGAAASVFSVAYPGGRFAFWAAAAVIAYSRVYCGVHYPGDVLAGLLFGTLLAWPWARLMLGGSGSAGKSRPRR